MRKGPLVLLMAAFLLFAVSACGGGGQPPVETKKEWAAGAKKTPDSNPPKFVTLDPGKYVTDEFEPAFTFNIGKGWVDIAPEEDDAFLLLSNAAANNSVRFTNVQSVYDTSSRVPERMFIPTPSDLTAWFQRHPYLKTSEPTPVSVGGVSGKQFDVVLSEVPPSIVLHMSPSPSCREGVEEECVPIFLENSGFTVDFFPSQGYRTENGPVPGEEYRVIVLDDVAGETVAIVESKIPDDDPLLPRYGDKSANEKFFSLAKELLSTVEWKGE